MNLETYIKKLRPHHIIGLLNYETNITDEEYINNFRKQKGNFHSNELILYWKNTVKEIHNNPKIKIKCITGLDYICMKCDKKEWCNDKKHWAHKEAMKADQEALKQGLEIGRTYTIKQLKKKLNQE